MTKAEALRRAKSILNNSPIGTPLPNEEYFFMMSVFENHPEWEAKMGTGVKDIVVNKAGAYNSRCFFLLREDGSSTDISYTKSLSAPTMDSELKKACRTAIMGEVLKFRDENVVFGVSVCPITGDVLTKENTHIDHYDLTFAELYSKWIETQNKQFLIGKLNKTSDNSTETFFTDDSINRSFRIFHNMNTHLRAVTNYANIVILRKP